MVFPQIWAQMGKKLSNFGFMTLNLRNCMSACHMLLMGSLVRSNMEFHAFAWPVVLFLHIDFPKPYLCHLNSDLPKLGIYGKF